MGSGRIAGCNSSAVKQGEDAVVVMLAEWLRMFLSCKVHRIQLLHL